MKHVGWCVCDLSAYTNIGDVSACQFLDDHTTSNGSVFFQGWAYKHNQMKFKLAEKDKVIESARRSISVSIANLRMLNYSTGDNHKSMTDLEKHLVKWLEDNPKEGG